MRRPLATGVLVSVILVVLPPAARAAAAPEITLRTPSAETVVVGETAISWSYRGFSPSAWVDVEASRAGEPYRRIARVRIDDGTPGYTGSTTWATGPDDDGADWTVRLVVASNKWVRSTTSSVIVDNTAPEATEVGRTPANAAGWNNDDVTVRWKCTDAASGPVQEDVAATVVEEGTDLTTSAVCTDRAGHSTTATAGDIDIDRTAPSATVNVNPSVPDTTPVQLGDAWGNAADELSGVAGVVVTFVDAASTKTQRSASCIGCGTSSVEWWASTRGLAPGTYQVTATATDLAGNNGTSSTATMVVVALPDVTVPEVTVPEVTPPATEPPATEPPATEPPEVTPPPVDPGV
jgi:hypothetical protein